MRLRLQLYTKILLWFFLNLVLLGGVFYLFVKFQFRIGLNSILLNQVSQSIQSVSQVMAAELRSAPVQDWDSILARFSGAYGVQFLLFRDDGSQIAGTNVVLPPQVQARLADRPGPLPDRRPLPLEGRGPPQDRFRFPGPPGDLAEGNPENGPPERLEPRENPPGGFHARFMLRTEHPTRYWVGGRIPVPAGPGLGPGRGPGMGNGFGPGLGFGRGEGPGPGPGFGRRPATLIAMSETLSAGGLFFDPTPWVVVGLGMVGLSLLFWFPLVRGITRSIGQMTRATERIAEGKFDVQLETRRGDELGRLGAAINRMAVRLAGFVAGQKRFLGDTAHELCSPIARIQLALGILEQRADPAQKDYVEDLREEVQHMSSLVNELLSFSKASLNAGQTRLQALPLRPLLEEVVRRESVDGADLRLNADSDLGVLAEPELLKRAVGNVVRNAIRYAGQAGPISVEAARQGGDVRITIADAGPGVPEEALPHLFDPFYRVDEARTRETGGTGLGLAIVKTCLEACGGRIACANRAQGGFAVTLDLPEAPPGMTAAAPESAKTSK
jgi:signal transduction histidine kinase